MVCLQHLTRVLSRPEVLFSLRPTPHPIILPIPFLPPPSFSSMFLKLFSLSQCLLFNDCDLLDLGSQTSLSENINKSCSCVAFQHLFSFFKISQRPSLFSQDLECKCSMIRHLNSTRRDGGSSYCSLSLGCSPVSHVHSTLSIYVSFSGRETGENSWELFCLSYVIHRHYTKQAGLSLSPYSMENT